MNSYFQGTPPFSEQNVFEMKNRKFWVTLLEVNVILKIYRKIKEIQLISENLCKNFKIVNGHLTYKAKKG